MISAKLYLHLLKAVTFLSFPELTLFTLWHLILTSNVPIFVTLTPYKFKGQLDSLHIFLYLNPYSYIALTEPLIVCDPNQTLSTNICSKGSRLMVYVNKTS